MTIEPIRRVLLVKTRPSRAFGLFTEEIGAWWPKGRSIGAQPHETIVMEPFVGGRWFERSADGVETDWGRVAAWDAPSRLLLNWHLNAEFKFDPAVFTEVEITFEPANGDQTLVRLEHRFLERLGDSAERVAGLLAGGWPGMLERFAVHASDAPGEAPKPFVVHGIPGSPYVRMILLALQEKVFPYEFVKMPFGGQRSPAYLARHPFGKIPAFEHDGLAFYETQAAIRYLDRIAPVPELIPTDPKAEARMNQLVGISDSYVMPDVSAKITFARVIAPRLGLPVDEAAVTAALPRAKICIDELARLMGQSRYFADEAITMADLMLAPHLDYFAMTPEGRAMMEPHANLTDWLGRMRDRCSMRNTTMERLMEG
jgi:glutathione S-transferase